MKIFTKKVRKYDFYKKPQKVCKVEIFYDREADMYFATGDTAKLTINLENENLEYLLKDLGITINNMLICNRI